MPFPTDMSDANLRKLTKRRMADRKALLPPDVKTSEFSAGGRAEDPLSHANHRPRRWLDEEDPVLQVKRRAPLLDSSLPELAGAAEPQQYTLRLQLGRLMFEASAAVGCCMALSVGCYRTTSYFSRSIGIAPSCCGCTAIGSTSSLR